MLTKRVSNASKPVKRVRTKNVDVVKPVKTQSISTTIPVNFEVSMFIDGGLNDQEFTNKMVYDTDVIQMLNTSETFQQLCKTFKMCKIRKVHGCIDIVKAPSIDYTLTSGAEGSIPINNCLINCSMLRTIQLGRYFSEYTTGQDVRTYDDAVSIGSNIFQTLMPGTSVHLSPEIQASGMMERSQYLDTVIFNNLKLLKNYNSTQYFTPTFYLAAKVVTPTTAEARQMVYNFTLDPEDFVASMEVGQELKLSCQFYVDVIFKDLENNLAVRPTSTVYSYLLCKYSNLQTNDQIGIIPIYDIGRINVYDRTFATFGQDADPMFVVDIIHFTGSYSPDPVENYNTAGYVGVYTGASGMIVKTLTTPFATTFPEQEGYDRYIIHVRIRSNNYNVGANIEFTLSGNEIYDENDVRVLSDTKYVLGNVAFMINRTI